MPKLLAILLFSVLGCLWEQLATLLRLTERYCVVYQTLAHPPVLAVSRKSTTA